MTSNLIHCPALILGAFEKVLLPIPLDLTLSRAPNGRKHIVYTCKYTVYTVNRPKEKTKPNHNYLCLDMFKCCNYLCGQIDRFVFLGGNVIIYKIIVK